MQSRNSDKDVDALQIEHDISSMDPTLFEDPIKLLEYLQKEDTQVVDSTSVKPASVVNKEEKNETEMHSENSLVFSKSEDKTEERISRKIEHVLSKQTEGLTLYEIQDQSGINDLDLILEILDRLRLAGRVERCWSRKKGGRSVYTINAKMSESNKKDIAIVKRIEKRENRKNLPSVAEIETEILRIFQLVGYPISADSLRWKSIMLSSVDNDYLQYVLLNLHKKHKTIEYTVNKGQTSLYALNPAMIQDKSPVLKNQSVQKKKNNMRNKSSGNYDLDRILESQKENRFENIKKWKVFENQGPYGYRGKDGKLSIVEEEACVVRKVFEMYDFGETISAAEVANVLNKEGYNTRNGCQIRPNLVLKIWRDKDLYLGKCLKYGKYPPILSGDSNDEDFSTDKINDIFGKTEIPNSKSGMPDKSEWKNAEESVEIGNSTLQEQEELLENMLLDSLKTHSGYYSLAELYKIEPRLLRCRRSKIISVLLELLDKGLIERKLDKNIFGATILKYRLKI